MILMPYLVCGIFFSLYTFKKIFENKEGFLLLFEKEFGEEHDPNIFLGFLFLSCLFAWPIMMANEINNKREL